MPDTPFTPAVGALTLTGLSTANTARRSEEGEPYSARMVRALGRRRHLIGYPYVKSATVAIDPPSIATGETAGVRVTVTGCKPNRRYRVVMVPPATLSTNLTVLDTPIVANNAVLVRLKASTTTDDTSKNWTAIIFSRAPIV